MIWFIIYNHNPILHYEVDMHGYFQHSTSVHEESCDDYAITSNRLSQAYHCKTWLSQACHCKTISCVTMMNNVNPTWLMFHDCYPSSGITLCLAANKQNSITRSPQKHSTVASPRTQREDQKLNTGYSRPERKRGSCARQTHGSWWRIVAGVSAWRWNVLHAGMAARNGCEWCQ